MLTRAGDTKIETRGSSVEEACRLWKLNKKTDEYANTSIAQNLNELLSDLQSQNLLSNDEAIEILETGRITIGSKTIVFLESNEIPTIVNITKGTATAEGTEQDPYYVSTIEDLIQLSINVDGGNSYSGKYIKMKKTLDFEDENSYLNAHSTEYGNLNGNDSDGNELMTEMTTGGGFVPIGIYTGTQGTPFSGIFDGNNNEIRNVYIKGGKYGNGSIFSEVENAEIKNLCVSGEIETNNGAAGIVNYVKNDSYLKIDNCYNEINIISKSSPAGGIVGLTGSNATVTITNSYNIGNINGTGIPTGGIIGDSSDDSTIIAENCHNTGDLTHEDVSEGTNYPVGGIIGYGSKATVTDCYNTGLITGGKAPAGGIIGVTTDKMTVNNCYNTGTVIGESAPTGGIVGNDSAGVAIINCYNTGNTKCENSPVGGIIGYCNYNGTIINCYNTGNVTCENRPAGGIIGYGNYDGDTIINCYNIGNITGKQDSIGGIIGDGGNTITNCYNDGTVTGLKMPTGGIVGYGRGFIKANNCYNTATITGGNAPVGGIVGYGSSITITNSHSIGDIIGDDSNILAEINFNGSVSSDCTYLLKETNALANGATGKTADEMTTIMDISRFVNLMNTKVEENNSNASNIKWFKWQLKEGLPVFIYSNRKLIHFV